MTQHCRRLAACLVLIALLGTVPSAGRSQEGAEPARGSLAGLATGHWIRLKGAAGTTSPMRCTELRRLAGDFLDGDWSIKAVVGHVDSARSEFALGPWRIRVTDRTVYDNSEGNFRGFQDVRPGMYVEVEGTYVRGREVLAAEIDDETDELERRPALAKQIEIVGKVDRLDPRERRVTVMGMAFRIDGGTRLRSVLD